MVTRLTEAWTAEQIDAYRRSLRDLISTEHRLTREAAAEVVETMVGLREQLAETILRLGSDSPSRAAYERALTDLNRAVGEWQSDVLDLLDTEQRAAFARGVELATAPLEAAGITGLRRAALPVDVALFAQYRADLVNGISSEVSKRIGGEIASVGVGASTPADAVKRIGRSLSSPGHFRTIGARARAILVTELGRANALGTQRQLEAHAEIIDVRKRWVSAHFPNARESHIEVESRYAPGGEIGPIPVDQTYNVAGFSALYPRDPSLPASESVHCRCQSIPMLPDEYDPGEFGGQPSQDSPVAFT